MASVSEHEVILVPRDRRNRIPFHLHVDFDDTVLGYGEVLVASVEAQFVI